MIQANRLEPKYKVLIVDDNPLICMGIKKMVPWEEFSVELVETAENGDEAIEAIQDKHPDIVITDIMMPGKNGLFVLDYIHEKDPSIKCIVISAYDDFHYAKEAMKAGTIDYILKPINKSELIQTVQKAISQIEREKDRVSQNLGGKIYLDIQAAEKENLALLFRFSKLGPEEKSVTCIASYQYESAAWIFLCSNPTPGFKNASYVKVDRHDSQEEIIRLCRDYMNQLAMSTFAFDGKIPEKDESPVDEISQIRLYLSGNNSDQLMNLLQRKLCICTVDQPEQLQANKNAILQFLKELAQISGAKFDEIWKLLDRVESQNTTLHYCDISSILGDISKELNKMCYHEAANEFGNRRLVLQLKKVIEENYNLGINLELLAKQFHYSPTYISKVFKQQMGCNINKFINKLRMQEAKKLIETTDMKIMAVSEKVGFKDYMYFIKQFRKYYGYTPGSIKKK